MAKSHDEELLRFKRKQQQVLQDYKQIQAAASGSSSGWKKGDLLTVGYGDAGFSWSGTLPASPPPEEKRVAGPFTREEFYLISDKDGGNIDWEGSQNAVTGKDEFYMVIKGKVTNRAMGPKEMGEWQVGYDQGFEDGQKQK